MKVPVEGGAIFNYDGAPKLSNCTFSYNQSAYGAGIYNYFDAVIAANPTIARCTFSDNSSSHATEGGGAAITNWNAQPTIYNSYFLRNTAPVGGAIWNDADGIGGFSPLAFANNAASDSGGALSTILQTQKTAPFTLTLPPLVPQSTILLAKPSRTAFFTATRQPHRVILSNLPQSL